MRTKALIFDLGNVLWHLDYKGWLAHMHEYNPSITDAGLQSFIRDKLLLADYGSVIDDEYLSWYQAFLNTDTITLKQAYALHGSLLDKGPTCAMSLLSKLKNRYRLFLLSNVNPWHARYIEEQMPSLLSFFEQKIYSFEEGIVKPSREIFDLCKIRWNLIFEETVFFDDTKANVDAGNRFGIESILVTNHQTFCDLLNTRFLSK
jgi:FMN phosphatase YigB (HAD superfamily)